MLEAETQVIQEMPVVLVRGVAVATAVVAAAASKGSAEAAAAGIRAPGVLDLLVQAAAVVVATPAGMITLTRESTSLGTSPAAMEERVVDRKLVMLVMLEPKEMLVHQTQVVLVLLHHQQHPLML